MNQPTATLALTKLVQPASKFFLMYGDRETGVRARHFAEALGAGLGAETGHVLALWRCEMLEFPDLAAKATCEAEGSDPRLAHSARTLLNTSIAA